MEPVVLTFSNNINAFIKNSLNRSIDKSLQTAIALHDALRLYGISYVSNPLTSYAEVSKNKLAVDTLKFPRETISYRSGDCSDLAILYCALLQSVQIETAFITIPGHIFMAFALKSTPDEARVVLTHSDEMIIRDDRVWIPIEVTERDETFLTAWQMGAREWRESLYKGQAGFYPIREAWKTYPPVAFPGIGTPAVLPDAVKVVNDFTGDLNRLIEREMSSRLKILQDEVARTHGEASALNTLGVLYARYDRRSEAEEQFQKALSTGDHVPSLVNLANLCCIKSDYEKAIVYCARAYSIAPRDSHVLLCYARVNNALEKYSLAEKAYEELKKIDPELAQRNTYLGLKGEASTRSAEVAGAEGAVIWDEQ
jgi:hypothetical protein